MNDREEVIRGIECCVRTDNGKPNPDCKRCPYFTDCGCKENGEDRLLLDALALLKAQEPRVMTLGEIKDYLDDPDGDKKPLWLEWHSIPALSGWVLASQVSDLMKRYMDSYNNTWRPWTSRPTDEQREATPWE